MVRHGSEPQHTSSDAFVIEYARVAIRRRRQRQQGDAPDQPSGREPAQQGTYSGEWRSLLQLGKRPCGRAIQRNMFHSHSDHKTESTITRWHPIKLIGLDIACLELSNVILA